MAPEPPVRPDLLEELVAAVAGGRTGRGVGLETVRRVVAEEAQKRGDRREIVKAAKRKLHQVYGAFVEEGAFRRARALLDALRAVPCPAELESAARGILPLHTSTAERLPDYERFYRELFAVAGCPETLLDVGCGFNPFSLALVGDAAPAAYHGWDIDVRAAELANRFLTAAGREPGVQVADCLCSLPPLAGDLALLLKLLPTLDQQRRSAAAELLRRVEAPYLAVSFPTRSVGGREKGMRDHYEATYLPLIEAEGEVLARLELSRERVYVLRRN